MSARRARLAAAVIAVLAVGATACTPTLRNHGYRYQDAEAPAIMPAEDSQATLLARLGNPSTQSTFGDTWYYISSSRETLAYQRPRTRERRIIAVSFDADGVVSDVTEYGVDHGREIAMVQRVTPTRGRELSFLEQILGNIGRLPTDSFGSDQDLPGGAGGPRRR